MSSTFTDVDGTIRLQGSLAGALSGASRAAYHGAAVTVADDATDALTWDTLDFGDDLLDRSDPAAPVVLASGIYAVTVETFVDTLTADGAYIARLGLASNEGWAFFQAASAPFSLANAAPAVVVSVTWYVAAGDGILARVTNLDGVAPRDFHLSVATVQQLA
jgi:hypothetical protein